MEKLTLTSIQAPNQDWIPSVLAKYLSMKLDIPSEFAADVPWQDRERLLDSGQTDMGWICGMPYVHKVDQAGVEIELLAAPVMKPARYQGKPIYFSDVIVRRESNIRSFEDLRGKRWAYNEPNSHSGYNLTRYMLAEIGEFACFFGSVTEAGSHQAALQLLLDGKIDGTSIDSTVLEIELKNRPEIRAEIRVIETWGPSPIPPWVIHKNVPTNERHEIRCVLLGMESDEKGNAVLADLGMKRFTRMSDGDYDPIRMMARKARRVRLGN